MSADYPILHVEDSAAWQQWLDAHHASQPGVWLRMARKASELRSPTYEEAVLVALRYGWIDGQAKRMDEHSWLQKYTPRGRRSAWSMINRERAEGLIARGEMHPAGLAAIEAARADGRWDRAYDSPARATVPADLQTALDASPAARARFETLSSGDRYSILYRIQTAVRPATRARRIKSLTDMLARGEAIRR